jgi:hypothetical protein
VKDKTPLIQLNLTRFHVAKILWSLFLALSAGLVYKYYQNTGAGDFQYYISNGMKIVNGNDPYIDDFRSGTFGPWALYLFSILIPDGLAHLCFFILNLLGVFSVFNYFKTKLTTNTLLLCTTITIWSAPFREIITDGQIVGLLYLLIFSSMSLLQKQGSLRVKKFNLILAAVFSAIAIDLKPHICLPIIVFIGIAQRRIIYLAVVMTILSISHLVIDIRLQKFTEIEWVQNLVGIQNGTETSKWPEQYNLWPILDHFIPAYSFWKSTTLICILLLAALLLLLSLKKREELIWFIVASFSMVIPYSHLYSLTLLVGLTLIRIFKFRVETLGCLFIIFVLVPRYWLEPRNIAFVFLMILALSIWNVSEKKLNFLINLKFCFFGLIFSIIVHLINDQFVFDENIERSIICVELVLISSVVLLIQRKSVGIRKVERSENDS